MASQPQDDFVTPEEYLALEERAERRSEYHDGIIVAMAGASEEHNLLVVNLVREIGNRLRGGPCRGYVSEMRVRIPARNLYCYPDLVVVCGEPRFAPGATATLLNPTLVIEVLADSTESDDRGKKFAAYRTLPSLREYVLVAQDEARIDAYRRDPDGRWTIGEARDLDATLTLATGNLALPLADLYEGIALPG